MFYDSHPDLVELDERLLARIEAVLEAEQQAAAVMARRSATMRDRLIEAEDRGATVTLHTISGSHSGLMETVAADHVEIATDTGSTLIPYDLVMAVSLW